jgi:serpin B
MLTNRNILWYNKRKGSVLRPDEARIKALKKENFMKLKASLKAIVLATMLTVTVALSACNGGPAATLLKKAAEPTTSTTPTTSATPTTPTTSTTPTGTGNTNTQKNYDDIYASAEAFAAKLAEVTYTNYEAEKNFAVAPVSVYMALALASQCAVGETKDEILTSLDLSDEVLTSSFSDFYSSLVSERKDDNDEIMSVLKLSNSVWVDKAIAPKQDCMDTLASSYHCSSYQTDFYNNNDAANQAIQNFVKEQTNGLIDKSFNLPIETLFALINTLYLKDVWNTGNGLSETKDKYTFTDYDRQTQEVNLLQGSYIQGQVYEEEQFSTFYTATANGYKLKFILPKDGYSVDDVFTQETIAKVNAIKDYNALDEENKVRYKTRCLFPAFKAEYDEEIKDILKNDFNLKNLFSGEKCDLSAFADPPAGQNIYCRSVQHVTDLTVDKKGIEGAAVTVFGMGTTGAADDPYTNVYQDFIVNKSFGFVLTSSKNVTLFSGVVKAV